MWILFQRNPPGNGHKKFQIIDFSVKNKSKQESYQLAFHIMWIKLCNVKKKQLFSSWFRYPHKNVDKQKQQEK
jgi:hypothetical protein